MPFLIVELELSQVPILHDQKDIRLFRPAPTLTSSADPGLELIDAVGTVSARYLRPPHHAHTNRLAVLQQRMSFAGRPVPGLTTHQAKGGEWDVVGVRLRDNERAALSMGLSSTEDMHRKIYVACTRARYRAIEVFSPAAPPKRGRRHPSPRG